MLGTFWAYWSVYLLPLAPILQAFAFFIETSSWLLKSQSSSDNVGLYVGRSNIFLYFSRAFTLVFTATLSFYVESGSALSAIMHAMTATFLVAAFFHLALFWPRLRSLVVWAFSWILVLPKRNLAVESLHLASLGGRLFWMTAITSTIFSISLSAPILGAMMVPQYRLSISYVGQIVNFFGTVVILFFVDQILFRAIDRRMIGNVIMSYVAGRVLGFVLVGLSFAYLGLKWQ